MIAAAWSHRQLQLQRQLQRLIRLQRQSLPTTTEMRNTARSMAWIPSLLMGLLALLSSPASHVVSATSTGVPGSSLSFFYYDGLCTSSGTALFQSTTAAVVAPLIAADPGLAPALLRMCFHDCFVEGCDASVLLNSTASGAPPERAASLNTSLRGFQVFDAVKAALEALCPGVYSCADIVQQTCLVAQKYLNQTTVLPTWLLRYGRRDGTISLASEAQADLPQANMNYAQLLSSFAAVGLNSLDLVALSGGHTYGIAHCITISDRLYNFNGDGTGTDPALDTAFAAKLKLQCPPGQPLNIINMDAITPTRFDNQYFSNVNSGKALFTSDNALKSDPLGLVLNSLTNIGFVAVNFAASMAKMSEIQVKLYPKGQIRSTCALTN